jgi:hypothetical protein
MAIDRSDVRSQPSARMSQQFDRIAVDPDRNEARVFMSRRQNVLNRPVPRTTDAKRRHLIRLFAALMLLGGVLTGLAQPAAARGAPERIDGNTYNGLDFGWSVSWDEDEWTRPLEEHADGVEYVALSTSASGPDAVARILATNHFGGDVDVCVENWGDAIRAGEKAGDIDRTEVDEGIVLPGDAAERAYTYTMLVSGAPVNFIEYVQCRPLTEGVNLILTLAAIPEDYEEALPPFSDLVDEISIDGAQPSASNAPAPDRIDGTTYNGLEYGWSLIWDDTDWTDPYEEHRDGTEYVVLSTPGEPYASGRVDATDMFGGDVDACVSGWDDMLRAAGTMRHIKETEVDSGIDLTDGAAEGAYSLDLKVDDQLVDFVVYVQCRPLGDDANLVLSLGVMPDYYEDALPLFADLVDGLAVDGASAASTGAQTGDAETGDRPTNDEPAWDGDDSETTTPIDEADSGIDGASYTGVNFDWSLTWDGHLWKPIEGSEDNSGGVDSFAIATVQPFAPVAVVMFKSTAEYDGDVDACAEDGWNWLEEGGESMTDIANADVELPEVPSDGAVMAYSYTFDEDDGEPVDFIALQECLPLDSMGATLVLHGMIPAQFYDDALPFFNDLVDEITIDFS